LRIRSASARARRTSRRFGRWSRGTPCMFMRAQCYKRRATVGGPSLRLYLFGGRFDDPFVGAFWARAGFCMTRHRLHECTSSLHCCARQCSDYRPFRIGRLGLCH
jgi:hypothetical protein